jgi:hypothetical protein
LANSIPDPEIMELMGHFFNQWFAALPNEHYLHICLGIKYKLFTTVIYKCL